MPRILIDDSLTIEKTLQPERPNEETGKPEPDLTQPAVTIKFRPPLSTALTKYLDGPPLEAVEKSIDRFHKFIGDYLVSWDIEDKDGKVASIDPKTLPEVLAKVPGPYLRLIEKAIIEGSSKVRNVEKN